MASSVRTFSVAAAVSCCSKDLSERCTFTASCLCVLTTLRLFLSFHLRHCIVQFLLPNKIAGNFLFSIVLLLRCVDGIGP